MAWPPKGALAEPDALMVVMTHGWPGLAIEFHKVVAPLTDPRSHGGDPSEAVDLVLLALPGHGFSDKPAESGWGLDRIADAWVELMRRLGYGDRWVAQGGDWDGRVCAQIGSKRPGGCVGIHLNGHRWPPSEAEISTADEHEQELVERAKRNEKELSGYRKEQETRPRTIGYALADSPVGQAAWIYEKYRDWTDNSGEPESIFSPDEMLDNIMMYWITDSGASSARLYWETFHDQPSTLPVLVPTAFSRFPKDIGGPSRRWAGERFKNIVRWIECSEGGHLAAFERPELFVEEVRAGLRAVQQETTRGGAS